MDSMITAAARALAAGDPLGALDRVALRDDAPALALRGIAMAQLGDLVRARALIKSALRGFGPKESLSRARCVVAEAEIALASRELGWPVKALEAARITLEAYGDQVNADHARYLQIRRLLLIGQLDQAQHLIAGLNPDPLPPALRTAHELVLLGIALRRLQSRAARDALTRARRAADQAAIAALSAEVEHAAMLLDTPVARLIAGGEQRPVLLDEVEALLASTSLVVDACRYVVRGCGMSVSLGTRPILFSLAQALAEAWPADVAREVLIARAFRLKLSDESHRARLRVEIGRLRVALKPLAGVTATPRGFVLTTPVCPEVVVLVPPLEEKFAALCACLADGESWSSSALALALSISQRTVQRALDTLAAEGKVQSFGCGRARRWMTPPMPGFATTLLLPAPLPSG
ncbi:helix-turn-helix domain-containing protein [Pseudomonas sp. PDM31]|uniref:helix-turn-helix domain-containing protein n=1 Tax=Pseudomonas sp. PDM31 TaxID=2854778 RepID=UPI001C45932F|nr:helix-turn-helix domain-containing protein [Pseudomonas sp. PDM31]MBV7477345.1 helix-turn-helix domain-containing protein [Pseudomonas sp. PDM31]